MALTAHSTAQDLVYFENFDVDNSANWTVNVGSGTHAADFFFDYSTVGIPSAPLSTNGTTRGLKLMANIDPATQAGSLANYGMSVSPNGFSITENFEMRFDLWFNYINGATQQCLVGGAGFGTAGTAQQIAQPAAGIIDSVFIGATTGDGTSSTADYRVYAPLRYTGLQDASGVYAAGSRNDTAAYYQTNFPGGNTPPAAQTNLYPFQAGLVTPAGVQSFKWRDVMLRKVANVITYRIDGVLIATVDSSTNGTLGGANILFNLYDINGNASTNADTTNLLFALFDNVRITNFSDIVTVSATVPTASEQGPTPGTFTITRVDSSKEFTVYYTMTGTASNGVDYVTLPGTGTFPVGLVATNITVTPIDDSIAELTETVALNISEGTNYIGGGLYHDHDCGQRNSHDGHQRGVGPEFCV